MIIIAAKDVTTLTPLLAESYQAKGSLHPAGFFIGDGEKNYVALRLDSSLNQEAYEPFEPVYHEYVHYLMRRSMSQLPLWLTEGLAEFYGNTRLEKDKVFVGAPSTSNLIILRQNRLLPLSVLFAVNASSPYYHENNKASIFYAESWALTHFLIARDWHDHTHRFNQFVATLGEDVAPEDAAKRTIGDPEELERLLRAYIQHSGFTSMVFPPPPGVSQDSFVPEPISEAESLAVRADFLVLNRRYAEARQMLEESLKSDPKLAAAYESMGLLYARQNQPDEANKCYAQAVALNSQSYFAHYYYAMNLLKGKLDDDRAPQAESSLRTAIKINPQFAPAYDALAYLLSSRNRRLEEAQMLILDAVTLEPGNVGYRLHMAELLVQMDRADDALRVAGVAASMAKTPEEWARAQSILENVRRYQQYKQRMQDRATHIKHAEVDAAEGTKEEPGGQSEHVSSREAPPSAPNSRSDDGQPPVLRHRDEGTATGQGELETNSQTPDTHPKAELLKTRVVATGTIIDSKCPGSARLELTLTSPSGPRHLYSDNYFKVVYSALNYTPQGILNPCSDLKGMRGQITYHPAQNHPEQGEIVAVQLRK